MAKAKTIFKAEGANQGLVLVEQKDGKWGTYYVVTRDRKMLDTCAKYYDLARAIYRAVDECYKDINKKYDKEIL